MTIWLLALLLLAGLAGLGYRQGAIKVAFSLAGILVGALLAVPLGRVIKPLFSVLGLKDPLLLYLLPPVVVFILFSIIFKIVAVQVHHKADVYYKYEAGDLRLALWERLNCRLGLCLALINAVLYLILLSFVIFSLSYATVQLASSEGDPRWMRVLNRLGKDLQSTGFNKVAAAIDHRQLWYQAADLAGLIYHNPLLEARLARYPAFLGLSERSEFRDIATDAAFAGMRDRHEPIMNVLENPKMQAVVQNPDLLRTIWSTLVPDIKDLNGYLISGRSSKYDQEQILGRWTFDVNHAMLGIRRAKPNMSSKEAQSMKRWLATAFANTSLIAMTDHQVLLKNLPSVRIPTALPTTPTATPPSVPVQNISGQWKGGAGDYEISFSGGAASKAAVEGDRLKLTLEGMELAFSREI